VAVLLGVAILGVPTQAQAAFQMTLADSDGNSITVNDNNLPLGTDPDLASQLGRIVFNGSIGAFDIQISVGTSNAPGTPSLAQLTINNTSISSAGFIGNKTVTLTLRDTGFFSPLGSNLALESQVSTTQLPANSNVTYRSFVNATPGTLLSLNTVGGTRISDTVSIGSSPFTLTSVTTFTVHGQGAGTELTVQTTGLTAVAVPVPAGMLLGLTGIPCAGLGFWVRRRNKA